MIFKSSDTVYIAPNKINFVLSFVWTSQSSKLNIGILQMTKEVTDRFNGIILLVIGLFWQKAIE